MKNAPCPECGEVVNEHKLTKKTLAELEFDQEASIRKELQEMCVNLPVACRGGMVQG